MNYKGKSPQYICTHLGEENAAHSNSAAVVPPIFATSLHVFDDVRDLIGFDSHKADRGFIYGRVDNPTVRLLETKLAALENADDAICFASGMAATTSAVFSFVQPGDHIVTVENVYGPARRYFQEMLGKMNIETTFVSGENTDELLSAVRPQTKLIYLESPTSVVFQLQDLQTIAAFAREKGIYTIVDNTWATPIHQQPLALGIDMSIHTMSKYIGGHSDIIGGVLCARQSIIDQVKNRERELFGGILGPFEGWLAVRGLRTMPGRLRDSSANGQAAASYLEQHPKVGRVLYPGLDCHPQRELAKRQMSGYSGLLSFELNCSLEQTITFVNQLRLFHKGVSWGGFESLVCMPMHNMDDQTLEKRRCKRNLVRIYTGLEDGGELLGDLEQALSKI